MSQIEIHRSLICLSYDLLARFFGHGNEGRRNEADMHSSIGLALRTAVFALIGFYLAQLAVAAGLLVIARSIDGELAGLLLILPAVAAGVLTVYCLRETAYGLKSR